MLREEGMKPRSEGVGRVKKEKTRWTCDDITARGRIINWPYVVVLALGGSLLRDCFVRGIFCHTDSADDSAVAKWWKLCP